MNTIQYTSLKYYNSIISDECLYVGILFNNLTTNERTFKTIHNFKRLEVFDDEIDTDFVKMYLNGIKYEVEESLLNINKDFCTDLYIKKYVNEFRFSKITTIKTADEDFIENTSKVYLKFDYLKKHRLTKDDELKHIRTLLQNANINYSKKSVYGLYEDDIQFDYVINDYLIKLFTFENKKQLKRMINTARNWAFIAEEVKEHYKPIFFYDSLLIENSEFDSIIKILKKNAYKVMTIQEGMDFIITNSNNHKIA